MNRMFAVPALLTLLALPLLPGAAAAQLAPSIERPIKFGIGGGPSAPLSDLKTLFRNGYHGRVFAKTSLPGMPVDVRLDFSMERFKLDGTNVGAGTGKIICTTLALQYGLVQAGPVRPYLLAGAGAYQVKTDPDAGVSASSTRFGVLGGGGVNVRLAGFDVFAEARLENIFTQSGFVDTGSARVLPVTFGVMF